MSRAKIRAKRLRRIVQQNPLSCRMFVETTLFVSFARFASKIRFWKMPNCKSQVSTHSSFTVGSSAEKCDNFSFQGGFAALCAAARIHIIITTGTFRKNTRRSLDCVVQINKTEKVGEKKTTENLWKSLDLFIKIIKFRALTSCDDIGKIRTIIFLTL